MAGCVRFVGWCRARVGGETFGRGGRGVRPEFVGCFAFWEVSGGAAVRCFHYIGGRGAGLAVSGDGGFVPGAGVGSDGGEGLGLQGGASGGERDAAAVGGELDAADAVEFSEGSGGAEVLVV